MHMSCRLCCILNSLSWYKEYFYANMNEVTLVLAIFVSYAAKECYNGSMTTYTLQVPENLYKQLQRQA